MKSYVSEQRKANTNLICAIGEAALVAGEDGKGKSGPTGYFKRLALRDPEAMAQLLAKVLRWPTQSPDQQSTAEPEWTVEELKKLSGEERWKIHDEMILESREWERSPPAQAIVEGAALVGEDGRGKGGLTGYCKRLARLHPQAMANLLGKVLPWKSQWPRGETRVDRLRSKIGELRLAELREHFLESVAHNPAQKELFECFWDTTARHPKVKELRERWLRGEIAGE